MYDFGGGLSFGWLTSTVAAATTVTSATLTATADASATRVTNGSYYMWGAGTEGAAFPSSYNPTTSASVSRSADICTTTNLEALGFNANEGTIIAEFQVYGQSSTQRVIQFDDGTANNRISISVSGGAVTAAIVTGGSTSGPDGASLSSGTVTNRTTVKVALAYKADDIALVVNGGAAATDSSWTPSLTLTTCRLGSDNAGGAQLFGTLAKTTIYPSRLPNATLQALTA
jgi:hypothetical protein